MEKQNSKFLRDSRAVSEHGARKLSAAQSAHDFEQPKQTNAREYKWVPALVVGLSLLGSLFYLMGSVYRGRFWGLLGIDSHQFPMGTNDVASIGAMVVVLKLLAFLCGVLIIFLFVFSIRLGGLALVAKWRGKANAGLLRVLVRIFDIPEPRPNRSAKMEEVAGWINSKVDRAEKWLLPLIATTGVCVLSLLCVVLAWSDANVEAKRFIDAVAAGDSKTLSTMGVNPICIERSMPAKKAITGWQIGCTEKFCAVFDGKRTHVVPLDNITALVITPTSVNGSASPDVTSCASKI